MPIDSVQIRKQAGPAIRDLDDVRLLSPATTDLDEAIPSGTEGTVVHVAGGGSTMMVEFAGADGVATVPASSLVRIGRSSP